MPGGFFCVEDVLSSLPQAAMGVLFRMSSEGLSALVAAFAVSHKMRCLFNAGVTARVTARTKTGPCATQSTVLELFSRGD